jgi:hypothetical protein
MYSPNTVYPIHPVYPGENLSYIDDGEPEQKTTV